MARHEVTLVKSFERRGPSNKDVVVDVVGAVDMEKKKSFESGVGSVNVAVRSS